MTNAQMVAECVRTHPGHTIYGLMRVVRRGLPCVNSYWYRDAYRAIQLDMVRMDSDRKLWPVGAN